MTQEKRITEYLPAKITRNQAMYLLKTVWPDAPEVEVIKAGILCQQYGLNPLMRQLFLLKFHDHKRNVDNWVTVLGIKATRQIAQQSLKKRGLSYSYHDGPRVMSEIEEKNIRGQLDDERLWAIVVLKDSLGNLYPGYGSWDKGLSVYGGDKGNDALNMAFIRAERNALDKLAPGELPDVDVGDTNYIVADYQQAITVGEREFQSETQKNIDELWGDGKPPTPATITSDTTTLEKPQIQGIAEQTKGVSPVETKSPPGELANFAIDPDWLKETLKRVGWSNLHAVAWLVSEFNLQKAGKSLSEFLSILNKEQSEKFVDHISKLPKKV